MKTFFPKDVAKGGMVGSVAGAVCDDEPMRSPCVVSLRLTITRVGANTQIDKTLFLTLSPHHSSLLCVYLLNKSPLYFMTSIDNIDNILVLL